MVLYSSCVPQSVAIIDNIGPCRIVLPLIWPRKIVRQIWAEVSQLTQVASTLNLYSVALVNLFDLTSTKSKCILQTIPEWESKVQST